MAVLHDFNSASRVNIEILQFQHVSLGPEWNYSLCDNFSRLYYVLDGEGQIITESETIKLLPNNIYLVPANMAFRTKCPKSLEKIFLHIRCTVVPSKDILSNIKGVQTFPVTKQEMDDMLAKLYDGTLYSTLNFRIQLEQLILDLVKNMEEVYAYDYALYRQLEPFYSYTASHIYANLSIAEIASNIGMSARHLSYQYKTATGGTVKSYLNLLLLEKIKDLLLTTNMSLKDISQEFHFNSEFYCSRFFKKCVGISPKEYRKINLATPDKNEQ